MPHEVPPTPLAVAGGEGNIQPRAKRAHPFVEHSETTSRRSKIFLTSVKYQLLMEESRKKKRLLTRWELFILITVVLLILYFILQKFGINMVEVTEDSEIIQKPHQ
jgi:hypothetical protein